MKQVVVATHHDSVVTIVTTDVASSSAHGQLKSLSNPPHRTWG